jgi:uncharacterized membrane protein SpoIIM required for sporulation
LQKGALQGVKIVAGLIPFFLIAAFIESFMTRHSEYSYTLNAILISASALFMIFYFFVYPYILTKNNSNDE